MSEPPPLDPFVAGAIPRAGEPGFAEMLEAMQRLHEHRQQQAQPGTVVSQLPPVAYPGGSSVSFSSPVTAQPTVLGHVARNMGAYSVSVMTPSSSGCVFSPPRPSQSPIALERASRTMQRKNRRYRHYEQYKARQHGSVLPPVAMPPPPPPPPAVHPWDYGSSTGPSGTSSPGDSASEYTTMPPAAALTRSTGTWIGYIIRS